MRLDQSMNKKTAIIFTRLEPISNNYKKNQFIYHICGTNSILKNKLVYAYIFRHFQPNE